MARGKKTRLTTDEVRLLVREAIEHVTAYPGTEEETARNMFEDLEDPRLISLAIETSFTAPPAVARGFIKVGLEQEDVNVKRTASEILVATAEKVDAVPLIEQAFESVDEEVRRRAAEALESMSTADALRLFITGIRDSAESVKRNVAESFELIVGSLQHPLRTKLVERLNDDPDFRDAFVGNPDPLVRRQMARALGFSRTRAAIPSLKRLLEDEDFEVRQETVLALFALNEPETSSLLREALHDSNYLVCSTVLDVLASMYGNASDPYLAYLKQAVEHESPDVRRHAIACLDRYPYSRVSDILKKASNDPDLEVSRRAGEIIGRYETGRESVQWLGNGMENYSTDEKLVALWEAGNIGQESSVGDKLSFTEGAEHGRLSGVRDILEDVLEHGSRATRLHAVGELTSLVDLADSPALRKALYDEDGTIRGLIADAFTNTRDAGLLVEALDHPDVHVRRRAAEVLVHNPGGPKPKPGETIGQERVEFARARAAGVEFCSAFTHALDDSDDEVRRQACEGLQDTASRVGFLPPDVVERVRSAADSDESYLVAEAGTETLAGLKRADAAPFLVKGADALLQWRGDLAKLSHGIKFEEAKGHYAFPGMETADARKFLLQAEEYGLSSRQLPPIAALLTGKAPAKPEHALPLLTGLLEGFYAVADGVRHSARALALLCEFEPRQNVSQWHRSISAIPKFAWQNVSEIDRQIRTVQDKNTYAAMICLGFLNAAGDEAAGTELAGALGGADVGAAAAAALALGMKDEEPDAKCLAALDALCREEDAARTPELYFDVLSALVRAGRVEWVESVCRLAGHPDIEFRSWVLQNLVYLTRTDGVADGLAAFVNDASAEPLARLGAVMALRGSGREVEGSRVDSITPDSEDPMVQIAKATARAMMDDERGAEFLKNLLRTGQSWEQMAAGFHLGLARIRTAIPIFSSVSDRNAPFGTRSACAGMLIKSGHGDGLAWFRKFIGNVPDIAGARVVRNLSRAVEETLPLMERCDNINLGRFL